jgi:replicative DNA helicase
VRERAVLRQLVATADEIAADALNPLGRDAETLLDEAESKIFKIAEAGAGHNEGFMHINPLLTQVVERIQELHDRDNPSDITGVPTGFIDLDQKTSGFQPGDLIIVAGRPSMGKTAFALNIAENVAVDSGLPVGVFSMEMGGAQLATRMLASIGRLNSQSLRTGRMSDDEWSKLSFALGKLHEAPIYIDETGGLSPANLRARAAAWPASTAASSVCWSSTTSSSCQATGRARTGRRKCRKFPVRSSRWPRNCRCRSWRSPSSRVRSRSVPTSGR